MLAIFKPVFASVWKRKETKIFLAFAFLFPTLFLASTFLPKGSNFMVPGASDGYLYSFVVLTGSLFKSSNDFTLPILALFYLTSRVRRIAIPCFSIRISSVRISFGPRS